MPPKGKNKNANQHDKRHESGLAAPGKKVTKQRSGTNLSGQQQQQQQQQQPNGRSQGTSITPPPLPSTGLNSGLRFPLPAKNASTETALTAAGSGEGGTEGGSAQEKGRSSSPASLDEEGSVMAASDGAEAAVAASLSATAIKNSTRRVSEAPAYRSSLVSSASSTLALAATILSSCPLRDAIAILILLLSLPPTLVITIHTLFASLTFVPPAHANLSWSTFTSVPSLGDWFHSTPGGPSVFTMLTADAVMTLIYLCSPLFAHSVYLDLCQAVIAISLSGATAGNSGPTNSVAICSIIVFLTHFLRYNKIHLAGLEYLRSLLHNLGTGIAWAPPSPSSYSSPSSPIHGWPRTLLGCHILAQGLVTLIRRTLQSYSSHQRATLNKKLDPEAVTWGDVPRASQSAGESGQDASGSLSTDGRPPGPSPAVREEEKRISSKKKRRKQGNQVRSRQPLWAAIASTKVTFLKEMEQKQASADAIEAEATNTHEHDDKAEYLLPGDRIWITELRSTEIAFRADLISLAKDGPSKSEQTTTHISTGIDKTKPFYVRMNGADWGSTRINGAADGNADDKTNRFWDGEIFGLTPLTNYSCEFVALADQQVICTTSIVTLPAPSTEQASTSVVPPPPQHSSLRPLSPISTLKQSIAAAEVKRDEARNKLKRMRKDHKNAASAIRREIEQLHSKVASSGGQDERARQRIMQLTQHLRQAHDAATALKDETDALGEMPEEEMAECSEKKRAWQAACDRKAAALADVDNVKSEAQRETAQLQAELASFAQKRERLLTRRGKLAEQLERLTFQKNANLSAQQKHEQDRAAVLEGYHRREAQFLYWIQSTHKQAEEENIRANLAFQQLDYLNNLTAQHQATLSGPPTPEGDLPGTNGPQKHLNSGFDFSIFGGFPQQAAPNQVYNGRGRSSSMLSGYSGFTDDLDAVPNMQERAERQGSEGSSGNGSQEDHTSPRPKAMSPIGPPPGIGFADKGRGNGSPRGSNNK